MPFGSDVQLNPQPIPPGLDVHPPVPITQAEAGADIGEPLVDAAAGAQSTTDSSIIIVGGAEAPVFSDVPSAPAEPPVVAEVEVPDAPMDEVASRQALWSVEPVQDPRA